MSAIVKNTLFAFSALFLLTSAFGFPVEIPSPILGGCESTQFGCCKDGVTACHNSTCLNCPIPTHTKYLRLGGCLGTEFGCCKNTTDPCVDVYCTNCPNITHATSTTIVNVTIANLTSQLIGGCVSTQFGCCHDNSTACSDRPCSNCHVPVVM